MKNLLVIMIIGLNGIAFGQNLVPNSSFENYSNCPDTFSLIEYADDWVIFRESPDYFNTCSSSPYCSVPSSFCGFQASSTGNAYAGLYTYHTSASNLREYLGCQLISPLEVGEDYVLKFQVSLPDSVNLGTNNLGVLLTTYPFYESNSFGAVLNNSNYTSSVIVTDTTSWVEITGTITADSLYQYMVIGNFYDDANTDTTRIDAYINPSWGFEYAYYFLDDIELFKDTTNDLSQIMAIDFEVKKGSGEIMISLKNGQGKFNVSLVNGLGQALADENFIHSGIIDIRSVPKGVYYLKLSLEGQTTIRKIYI